MARALHDGHFPVRWSQNFGYGYGMPLFQFYGPLPFYLGGILYLFSQNVILNIKALFLLSNVGTALGGYLLGKKLFGRQGGLVTAAALTLAPYRAVNLFVRGALSESWAIMFLPWILLGAIKIFHQEKQGWLVFCLGLVGLFLSHNITTMLFLPVLVLFVLGYLLMMVWRQASELYRNGRFRGLNLLRISSRFLGGGLLAAGMSAFYLVPAFFEKGFTQVENFILTSYFDYHLHFLYIRQFFNASWGFGGSEWGVTDGISFFLGWGQWFALGLFALVLLARLWQWIRKEKAIFPSKRVFALTGLFGLLLGGGLYMSLLKSQWLWDALPLLAYAQFPWRWLSIGIVMMALLVGAVTWFLPKKLLRGYLSLWLVVIMAVGSAWYFRPESYLEDSNQFYYTDPHRIRRQLSGILPDYISSNMATEPSIIPEGLVVNEAELDAEQYQVLVDRTQEKLVRTDFDRDTLLNLAVAEYPGWQLTIDDQRWNRQHGPDGNIAVLVPSGEHLVSLRFLDTPLRAYADWASLLAWVVFVYLLLPGKSLAKLKEQS